MLRIVTSLFVAALLFTGTNLFAADKPVKGSITKIEKDKDKVVLVVEVTAKKKGDAATTTDKTEKKFTITSATRIEKVTGKKDEAKHTEAKLEDLKEGQQISLTLNGDKVEKVEFKGGKKGK